MFFKPAFRFFTHFNFGQQLTRVLLQVGLDGSTIGSKSLINFSSGWTNNFWHQILTSTNNFNQHWFQADGILIPHLQSNTWSLTDIPNQINFPADERVILNCGSLLNSFQFPKLLL